MTESIQLIEIDEGDSRTNFVFGRGALKKLQKLLLSDDVKDRSVVVISITGALRTGKSFLLSFLLKYLSHMYSNENSTSREGSWLGDGNVPLKGFKWKCGRKRVTTGIQMWPEIFYATLPDGEKVAIILLDTQGMFDSNTTFEVNTKIFALSTMISSLNVYNLKQNIQEDNLHFLKFFTDYGSEAMKVRGNMPNALFGKMLFLVRDWQSVNETGYGYAGGRKVKDDVLEIKDDQKPELKSVRRLINSSFSGIDAFLMPHPGLDAAEDPEFDGRLSDIRRSFKNSLEELVPSLLTPENLIPKKIEGHKVTAAELFQYLALYVNKLNSDEMPTPRGIFEANAEMSYRLAFEDAFYQYIGQMDVLCGQEHAVDEDALAKHHEACCKNANTRFSDYPKFQDVNSFAVYETKLNEEIDRLYVSYASCNKKKKELDELMGRITSQDQEINRLNMEQIKKLKEELQKECEQRQNEALNFEQIVGRIVTLGIPYLIRQLTA